MLQRLVKRNGDATSKWLHLGKLKSGQRSQLTFSLALVLGKFVMKLYMFLSFSSLILETVANVCFQSHSRNRAWKGNFILYPIVQKLRLVLKISMLPAIHRITHNTRPFQIERVCLNPQILQTWYLIFTRENSLLSF